MTKEGKTILCKTDNIVPLVVPALSTSSGSNSSSTSTSLDLSSTGPAQERNDGLDPRDWCGSPQKTKTQVKERDDNQDSDNRLRDLPEWLEESTDNLEDTEVHAPAHISHDSDSEHPTRMVSKSRKHSTYTHFPKGRNCQVCLRTKMTRTPCRRRTSEALLRAEKFGDLITSDNGFNSFCSKQRLHRRRKRAYELVSVSCVWVACVWVCVACVWVGCACGWLSVCLGGYSVNINININFNFKS